jgi:hypothetical protein
MPELGTADSRGALARRRGTMRFVQIKNISEEPITLYPRFERPKKEAQPRWDPVRLKPRQVCDAMPEGAIAGSRGWHDLVARGSVEVTVVSSPARFVAVEPVGPETVRLPLMVRPPNQKLHKHVFAFAPGRRRTVHLTSIKDSAALRRLVKQRKIRLERAPYIAPSRHAGSYGSFGDEQVYVCWKCGGAIVFRGSPPTPIHV